MSINLTFYFFPPTPPRSPPPLAPAAEHRQTHAFDTNFSAPRATGPKVALLSTLLKALDVFSLFSADGDILSRKWEAEAAAAMRRCGAKKYGMSVLDSTNIASARRV